MPLTATQAAELLKINPKTLRQKLRDGKIKGRQVGKNTWVIEERDLEAYKAQKGRAHHPHTSPLQTTPPGTRRPNTNAPEITAPAPDSPEVLGAAPKSGPVAAWLLLAVGENRAFGSNDGYDDEPEVHYKWDDTVPNRERISVGDAVVLWDKKTSIGASVIESIDTKTTTKPVYSCPECNKAHIKPRKSKRPLYKCFKCKSEFDQPTTTVKEVVEYTSTHSRAYVDLSGLLPAAKLRALCESPKSQLSLRPLKWEPFKMAVAEAGGPELMTVVEASWRTITGGHRTANVRVRIGQAAFRRELLTKVGSICAFTGPAPAPALEAAHLYSYAKVGEHREYGGLLMRRDLHRLFDAGLIAVCPETLTIDIGPSLANYPAYQQLAGHPLTIGLTKSQVQWLAEHWDEHRASAKRPVG
ncbi:helix-turn-helix domain-containing protein [Paenarthrobacter ureafaciens]|uniref:helix-turn-helix domain-containing protein n=1 Tax=Paenarthrobacter ureafaciens TaxID=37931 RepID=UPI001916E265|nr:helix-turn-helix domain-containing protein [Paenarthrobacter ureafaciens]QQQ64326.1 helix-turn-helix domain-containing protein [Paenarthrobacter ureafaciens]